MKKALALILSVLMVVSVAAFGSFSVAAETTTLIESGADWDYYYVLGEETLPEGWYEVGFDTSDWELGATPFTGTAYANENANTQIDAQGEKLTAAFVTTFTVEDASALQVMTMGLFYDENPVVYINGTKVFTASNWNNSIANFDLTDAIDSLVDGENTIAVYMENAVNGGGFHMDLTLEAGTPDIVDADGNVTVKEATKTGFADFGGVNAASNILDGKVDSCSGSGRDVNVEQSWTVTFWGSVDVSEIYLQTKGKEDNGHTTTSSHTGEGDYEAGVIFGYYNVYVGETLVKENAPAISAEDGGYTITLDTPVTGSSVKVELTGDWYAGNWANLADIAIKGTVSEDDVTPPEPAIPELTIKPYTGGGLKGVENWPASDLQTNLLVQTAKANGDFKNNTWVLTIDGEEYEMTVASVGAIGDDYIYRFHICLADKPFIPVVGTEFTVSAKIYDGETLVATTNEAAGFAAKDEPIVPETPDVPVEPTVDTLEINPYVAGEISGWENWSGQTQLLIRVDNKDYTKDLSAYTWEITLKNGDESKTISLVPSSAIVAWLYRFETCLGEGENQFIPVNGTEYTVSVKVYDGETLVAESAEVAGFKPFQEPIVPEEPIDPPVDPGEDDDDEPGQTGDAAVYATIAVAVAAVALAVVFKRRSTI